jgi:hypothetical protein
MINSSNILAGEYNLLLKNCQDFADAFQKWATGLYD